MCSVSSLGIQSCFGLSVTILFIYGAKSCFSFSYNEKSIKMKRREKLVKLCSKVTACQENERQLLNPRDILIKKILVRL